MYQLQIEKKNKSKVNITCDTYTENDMFLLAFDIDGESGEILCEVRVALTDISELQINRLVPREEPVEEKEPCIGFVDYSAELVEDDDDDWDED